jgi:hypothetical protein
MAGTQECENCHAPLPLGAPGSVVSCPYCRAQNRIAGMTGVMPAASYSPYGAPSPHGGPPPYGAPPSPYGAPPSPYGAPPSPYGAPPSPYGPPGPHVPMAAPLRAPSNPGAIVLVAVIFALTLSCGIGMAAFMIVAR